MAGTLAARLTATARTVSASPPTRRARRGSGGVTLSDVARLAGVAPITASRALNTPAQVSPEVLERVRAAVEQTGYIPNRMAGSLASARSRLIAAIVPSSVVSVFNETLDVLNAALFDAGYQLMLGQTNYSTERHEALLEAVISRRPDGVFHIGVLPPGRGRTRLLAANVPVLEAWDLAAEPIDMLIGFSHAGVGTSVADFLLSKKKRSLAVIQLNNERAVRRGQAFEAAARAGGAAPVHVLTFEGERSLHGGREALGQLLQRAPEVDAVFCSSDQLALGVLIEARARGLDVPGRLAVVGFGDEPHLAGMLPALTTVRVNGARIGSLAAQYLVARAEGETVAEPVVDVGYAIIERDST